MRFEGKKHTKKTKRILSKKLKKLWLIPEYREKTLSKSWHSPEWRALQGEKLKNFNLKNKGENLISHHLIPKRLKPKKNYTIKVRSKDHPNVEYVGIDVAFTVAIEAVGEEKLLEIIKEKLKGSG
jgi:hypothetical protein